MRIQAKRLWWILPTLAVLMGFATTWFAVWALAYDQWRWMGLFAALAVADFAAAAFLVWDRNSGWVNRR